MLCSRSKMTVPLRLIIKTVIIHILSPFVVLDLFINFSSCEHYKFWTSICYLWPICLTDLSVYILKLSSKKHNFWIILTIRNTQMKHSKLFITDYFGSKLLRTFVLKSLKNVIQSHKVTPVVFPVKSDREHFIVYKGNYPKTTLDNFTIFQD